MANRRIQRLNEQLRREITDILRTKVRDPRVGLVTVTSVDTTPDLYRARVYLNTLGDPAAREDMLAGVRSAAPFIRSELARTIRVRHMPELHFEIDRSLEHALRIERLLDEVLPGDEAERHEEGDA
ncbi:MAG: 30S ribosome-binding factor RbfA [Longimicrobiales bacterium]